MKTTRSLSALLLAVLMLATLTLTSCQKKEPPVAGDQVAMALFEMILKNNAAPSVEIFGYADEAAARADWGVGEGGLLDEMSEELADEITSQFASIGLNTSAEDAQTFIDAFMTMLGKIEMSAKVKETDEKAGTAVVTCTVSSFDTDDLTNVMSESLTSLLSNPDLLADEDALTSALIQAISEGISQVSPSSETTDFDVDFELSSVEINGKARDAWLPKDMEAFGAAISTNALGG